MTKDNGLIIVGEPYWKEVPSQWYLDSVELEFDDFGTHVSNISDGEELGLRPIFCLTSSADDWEWYEHLQWLGVDHHLVHHPKDPDNETLVAKFRKSRDEFLREGRNVLGWAIYVFRKKERKD